MYAAYAWLRARPTLVDAVLALALLAASSGQLPTGSGVGTLVTLGALAVSVVLAATVVVRRRYPVAAFVVAALTGAAQITLGVQPGGNEPQVRALGPSVTDLAIVVLLYTLAAYRPRRVSVAGLAVCLLGAAVSVGRWAPVHQPGHPAALFLVSAAGLGGAAVTAWVLGDSMAYRRAYYASLEERAARLEAERDAQARIAAAAERARELQERRARAVDESAARLRRIERDLHDGAQVRLAALALALGEIKESLDAAAEARSGAVRSSAVRPGADGDDTERTRALVSAAHRSAKETLVELRDLARGIHPQVLDRGLDAALTLLAEASAIPVAPTTSITRRPSPAIEAIAYFCAAELLANVTKHSGASGAAINVSETEGKLLMTVADDGAGQARLVPGGGLAGLLERVQTVDGQLTVDSPAGGPTIVTIELPGHV